jgi:hypothetical protein
MFVVTLTVVALIFHASASRADFLGDSVAGSLALDDVPTVFTSGSPATVADPGTEFQFTGDQFELTADFSGNRGTTLDLQFVRTGPFGEAPNTTWIFSDLTCIADPSCTIVGIEDLGGTLVVQSATVTGPHAIEIKTAATSGGSANQGHQFRIVSSYAPVRRSQWAPNVGTLASDERPLGDLWTFVCKPGQRVSIFVDTKDDGDASASHLDPAVQLVDGAGALLGAGDDQSPCTYAPVCGFRCPRIVGAPCGPGKTHSIIVRDSGTATTTADTCSKGGGYELEVVVLDAGGVVVPEKKLGLGGAPAGKLPAWLASDKKTHGPALDDESVPRF